MKEENDLKSAETHRTPLEPHRFALPRLSRERLGQSVVVNKARSVPKSQQRQRENPWAKSWWTSPTPAL